MLANVLAGECGEVSHSVPHHEIVGCGSIEHGDCCLGELKIKTNTQRCGPICGHGNKVGEINSAGDADKVYILLMAVFGGSILHWEEKGRIAGNGGIVDARASQVMVRDDGKVPEIEPHGEEEATPIVHQAIDNCAAVQLGAHHLKNEACIDSKSFEHALGYLKSMCALKNGHTWLNLGVNGGQKVSNLDSNEVLGDKQYFVHFHGS